MIKTKKCWKCNRSFQFKNSFKIVRTVTLSDAIKIIKKIKMKGEKETLFKFLDYEKSLN